MFNLEDRYIIVNYHYVRDPSPNWGGIYPCSVSEFDRQIKFLSENYKMVSVPEVYEAAKNNSAERLCSITFDDGLNDQYENAVPILKKYNATGTFFIITSTLFGLVPSAHKIHIITSKIPVGEIIESFNAFLSNEMRSYLIPIDKRLSLTRRLHEDILSANFKETMIAVPDILRDEFLKKIFKDLKIEEIELAKDLFMNEGRIRELTASGFYPESHTHSHASLENSDIGFLERDFLRANSILKPLISREPEVMSYPHGRSTKEARELIAKLGFKFGVTIERRALTNQDDNFMIPRYDSNDLRDFLNTL